MPANDYKAAFDREGALFPVRVLEEAQVQGFLGAFEEVEALAGQPISYIARPHHFFPWAFDLARHPAILDTVEEVLGPDLLAWSTLILCKQPRTAQFAAWHQDGRYDNVDAEGSLTAWVALTPSRRESGCMRVISGSHRQGLKAHDERGDGNNILKRGTEIRIHPDETLAVDLELEPGEMSLHHNHIVHGSGPNGSDRKRLGFIIRYAAPAAASRAEEDNLTLVRGNPLPGQRIGHDRPHGSPAEALAGWQASLSAATS